MSQFNALFQLIKKPWFFLIYALIVALIFLKVDRPLATYLYSFDLRNNLNILNLLTALGKESIYLVLFSLLGLLYRFIRINARLEMRMWYLLLCIVFSNLMCLILKVGLGRARPELYFSQELFGFYWFKLNSMFWSFPSGHTTVIATLASALGVLFPRFFSLFLFLALSVALSRVLLYYHFLSDVMAGLYLGVISVGLLTQYLQRKHYLMKAF